MVYKRLDPAADWDAYCMDHPEPPQPEDVDERFHVYECPSCGTRYGEDDFNDTSATVHVDRDCTVYCTACIVDGRAPQCRLDIDLDAWQRHCAEQRADAIAEYGEARVNEIDREWRNR